MKKNEDNILQQASVDLEDSLCFYPSYCKFEFGHYHTNNVFNWSLRGLIESIFGHQIDKKKAINVPNLIDIIKSSDKLSSCIINIYLMVLTEIRRSLSQVWLTLYNL